MWSHSALIIFWKAPSKKYVYRFEYSKIEIINLFAVTVVYYGFRFFNDEYSCTAKHHDDAVLKGFFFFFYLRNTIIIVFCRGRTRAQVPRGLPYRRTITHRARCTGDEKKNNGYTSPWRRTSVRKKKHCVPRELMFLQARPSRLYLRHCSSLA